MNAKRLLQHYEQIADAPDAIARLRRFILDLAVRGKLVPQDAADEPASELLKQISEEKARRVKAGELRKPRDLDSGDGVLEPYLIPLSWRWVRLDVIGAIVGGGTPSAADADNFAKPGEGVPWLTPADLGGYSELYISRGSRDLSDKGARVSSATLMPKGTVLFTSRAPIGYVAIAANPISTNQGFKSIVPYVTDCSRFIAMAMQAFAPEIDAKAPGTTFKEVSGKIVAAVPFPLPPLAEQHRIVAKVDELMALCDELDAARTERETKRDRLAAASLARLNTPDPETFRDDGRFVLGALPALTARPDQIKQLRQTILNLAVRGKLVPQDPQDEPAEELLKRQMLDRRSDRAANRLQWSDTKTAKVSTLPVGWVEVLIDHLAQKVTDGEHFRPPTTESGVYFLSAKDIREEGVSLSSPLYVSIETAAKARARCNPEYGDILIVSRGATCGRVCVVDIQDVFCLLGSVILLKLSKNISSRYVAFALRSQSIANALISASGATAQGAIYRMRRPRPIDFSVAAA